MFSFAVAVAAAPSALAFALPPRTCLHGAAAERVTVFFDADAVTGASLPTASTVPPYTSLAAVSVPPSAVMLLLSAAAAAPARSAVPEATPPMSACTVPEAFFSSSTFSCAAADAVFPAAFVMTTAYPTWMGVSSSLALVSLTVFFVRAAVAALFVAMSSAQPPYSLFANVPPVPVTAFSVSVAAASPALFTLRAASAP